MIKRALVLGSVLFLAVLLFVSSNATADFEPNNSFDQAESIGEGDHSGSVNLLVDNDDFYKVTIPSNTKMTVKIKKTDSGEWGISVESYDSTKKQDYAISMYVSEEGERDTDTHSNYDQDSETYYLKVSGGGTYEIEIEYEDSQVCCCGSILAISGVLITVIGVGAVFAIKKIRQ